MCYQFISKKQSSNILWLPVLKICCFKIVSEIIRGTCVHTRMRIYIIITIQCIIYKCIQHCFLYKYLFIYEDILKIISRIYMSYAMKKKSHFCGFIFISKAINILLSSFYSITYFIWNRFFYAMTSQTGVWNVAALLTNLRLRVSLIWHLFNPKYFRYISSLPRFYFKCLLLDFCFI